MSKMLADCSARHEQTLMLQVRVGMNMFPKDVEGGIDERDGQVEECSSSIVTVGNRSRIGEC